MMNEFRGSLAIMTSGLTKSFGGIKALQGVNLEVERGEIYGFLGPNGAGKTTTIRCFLDLIRRDSGQVELLGLDPQDNPVEVKRLCGYLPGELTLAPNMTAERQLGYFHGLRGKAANWNFVLEIASRLDLDLKRPIKSLSKGNKQKIGVIQAMMHKPDLLLLDEPTSGLDPLIQQEVLALIREASEAGAAVFFSSHVMGEVEAAAERVGIIRQGKIVEVADTAELTNRFLLQTAVKFKEPVDTTILTKLSNVQLISKDDGLNATVQVWGDMDELIKVLASLPVATIETERPSLEKVFLEYYKSDRDIKEVV